MKKIFQINNRKNEESDPLDLLEMFSDEAAKPDRQFYERLKLRIGNRLSLANHWLKNIYHIIRGIFYLLRFKNPGKDLILIGVTGTSGKTTVLHTIYHIFKKCGLKVGIISSLGAYYNDVQIALEDHLTTPDVKELQKILYTMKRAETKYVLIEASSIGLDQRRLIGLKFDSIVITNIGTDHLSYHKSWNNYADSKFRFIKQLKDKGFLILNKDHKSTNWLKKKVKNMNPGCVRKWVSIKEAKNVNSDLEGIRFKLKNLKYEVPMIGQYNLMNILQAINLSERYISDAKKIKNSLKRLENLSGRMKVLQKEPFVVILDRARQAETLKQSLKTIVEDKNSSQRVITLFGCSGERDIKRREMGKVSAAYSDITILSIQDPRGESVEKINEDIIRYAEKGAAIEIERFNKREDYERKILEFRKNGSFKKQLYSFNYQRIQNRKDAVELALKLADAGDILLFADLGSQQFIEIGNPSVFLKYNEEEFLRSKLKIDKARQNDRF